jgi:hypothetical protein
MKCISYKGGYKYQLYEEYSMELSIKPSLDIFSSGNYVVLTKIKNKGTLTLITCAKISLWHDWQEL